MTSEPIPIHGSTHVNRDVVGVVAAARRLCRSRRDHGARRGGGDGASPLGRPLRAVHPIGALVAAGHTSLEVRSIDGRLLHTCEVAPRTRKSPRPEHPRRSVSTPDGG